MLELNLLRLKCFYFFYVITMLSEFSQTNPYRIMLQSIISRVVIIFIIVVSVGFYFSLSSCKDQFGEGKEILLVDTLELPLTGATFLTNYITSTYPHARLTGSYVRALPRRFRITSIDGINLNYLGNIYLSFFVNPDYVRQNGAYTRTDTVALEMASNTFRLNNNIDSDDAIELFASSGADGYPFIDYLKKPCNIRLRYNLRAMEPSFNRIRIESYFQVYEN